MNIERLSLDQLRVFQLVAVTGSFSAAARKLMRAQSAVSHAIAALETQLDLVLFDRSSYRPQLTAAGRLLLPDVSALLERIDRLESQARLIARGVEPEVVLAVDGAFPLQRLIGPLRRFHERFPAVALRFITASMSDLVNLLDRMDAEIGILCTLPALPEGYEAVALEPVRVLPVAAPSLPLARSADALHADQLRDALQVVLGEREGDPGGPQYGVFSARTWRTSDLATKRELLLAGFGWGGMPLHLVEDDLNAGRLVHLATSAFPREGDVMPSWALHSPARRLGPAALCLLAELRLCAEAEGPG